MKLLALSPADRFSLFRMTGFSGNFLLYMYFVLLFTYCDAFDLQNIYRASLVKDKNNNQFETWQQFQENVKKC